MAAASNASPSSISSSLTNSDGAKRMVSARGAFDHQASRQRGPDDILGLLSVERGAEQEPGSADALDTVEPFEARPQPRSGPTCPGRDVLGLHDRQRGPRRRGGQGLAAEGAAVVAGRERRGHLGAGPASADGDAVAERLGHGHHVGIDAGVLKGEPPTRAPQAGLDLVHHEQDAALGAHLPHRTEVVR